MSRERIGDVIATAAASLRQAGVESPQGDARLLAGAALGIDRSLLLAAADEVFPAAAREVFQRHIERRIQRYPVSRILGRREFWGLDIALNDAMLDPRPDSETLIEAALAAAPGTDRPLIVDLGTGSGCLLLALLSEWPAAQGVGIDIAVDAAVGARGNAVRLGLKDRSCWIVDDWAGSLPDGCADIVIANPPYIPEAEIAGLAPEVSGFEPRRALSGGSDGLDSIRCVAASAARILRGGGRVHCEFGAGQEVAVDRIFAENGFIQRGLRSDLAGRPRCLSAEIP